MRRSAIAVAAVAAAMFLASGVALATDLVCTGPSSGGTWHNVTVPVNASCTLDNTRVTGNVTVQTGGSLIVNNLTGDSTINGDVKADGCSYVEFESASTTFRIVVGGNVTIQNCTGGVFSGGQGDSSRLPPGSILLGGNVKCSNNADACIFDYFIIGGNLECSGNAGGCTLQSDAVGKNATINNNAFGFGDTEVRNSSFGGDVKCSGNTGGVTSSPTNTVAGNKSGQCSGI